MPEKPLLIFPSPVQVGRYKIPGGQAKPFITPSKQQQIERVEPSLDVLESALREKRVALQSDVSGVEPEMVLVLETRGLVENFFKAVKHVPELEWLGEWEDNFESDDFFYYTDRSKQVRGKLFFILTNYQALRRLLRLWNSYKYGGRFARGTTKWRDVFDLLYDIRPWGIQDRIFETGLLSDLNDRILHEETLITFEIELWFRKTPNVRQQAVERLRTLAEQFDGEILSQSVIEEISYHGLLVKAPIGIFDNLTDQTDVEFFQASDIMYLRPVGQCAVRIPDDAEVQEIPQPQVSEPLSAPIIALLDGLPLQNHSLLADRLIIDDPDNYGQNYLASARYHGTSMSSAIIYGGLEENETPIRSRLYVRPIMKVASLLRGNSELIPEDVLLVDLMHRAVKRMFERDGNNEAVAPTVKIINLSMGDPFRVLDTAMSAWAKLLDWLSCKYNVLFLVSAGNCADDLDYSGHQGPFGNLLGNANALRAESLRVMYNNNRHRKIIAPGESINALTVGASDSDGLDYTSPQGKFLLFGSPSLLSPLSRMGLGYRRSIKPELLIPGGRALYREKIGQSVLTWIHGYGEPGIKVAAPSGNGALRGTVFTNGTSVSTAKLSHLAAKLHESIVESNLGESLTGSLFPLVAKSLLVHSASWDVSSRQEILAAVPMANGNERDMIARFLGYGNLTPQRVFECTDKRVTLIGSGSLTADHAHQFNLPIPAAISGSTLWRSLTATLAWFSPVNTENQAYRQAKLWFDFPERSIERILNISRKFYDNDTVNRGTIQHEIFDGTRASAFLAGALLPIRVNCKEDAPGLGRRPVNYVIAVTLEVSPTLQADIYTEILNRIRPVIPVQS